MNQSIFHLSSVLLPSSLHTLMTVIMVKNRTEWADVLPFGLETLRCDGRLLTLLEIESCIGKLQLGVGLGYELNLGVKMQDSVQALRCLCVTDSARVCTSSMRVHMCVSVYERCDGGRVCVGERG